jgi:hypothetical protein
LKSAKSPAGSGCCSARWPTGEGATLQEAADDLVARVLALVMAFGSGGIGPVSNEAPPPDPVLLNFLYELGDIAAAGGDIRERLFS